MKAEIQTPNTARHLSPAFNPFGELRALSLSKRLHTSTFKT